MKKIREYGSHINRKSAEVLAGPVMIDLLYIHPHGQLNDDAIVPVGAITCVNAYKGSKVGVLAPDLTEELLASAKVVAIDLFWVSAYEPFRRIVEWVKQKRPDVPVIAGGYTAAMMPNMLKKNGIDYVLTGLNCEVPFSRIVSTAAGRRFRHAGSSARCRVPDPVPGVWLSGSGFSNMLNIHLARGCVNRMGCCPGCTLGRYRRTNALLYSRGQLRKIIGKWSGKITIWANGMSPGEVSSLLNWLKSWRSRSPIVVLTCGELPRKMADIMKNQAGQHIRLTHIVFWKRSIWRKLSPSEREEQKQVIEELLPLRCVELVRSSPTSEDIATLLDKRRDTVFRKPLNWNFPAFQDNPEGVKLAQELSAAANRVLPLRILCPSIFRQMNISYEPQYALPENLPGLPRSLTSSMRKGLAKWGTILPVRLASRGLIIRLRPAAQKKIDGSLIHRTEIEIMAHSPLPVAVEVTPFGWNLRVDTSSLPHGKSFLKSCGIIIVPAGFKPALSEDSSWPIRAFPLDASRPERHFDIEIAGYRVRWPGEGWIDVQTKDGVPAQEYFRFLSGKKTSLPRRNTTTAWT